MEDSKNQLVEVIKQDCTIKCEIPVDIYYRLNQFIMYSFPFKDKEDLESTLEKIKQNIEDSPQAYHLRTLLSIQMIVEENARQQGLTEMLSIEEIQKRFKLVPEQAEAGQQNEIQDSEKDPG
jgi:hypothetical protein